MPWVRIDDQFPVNRKVRPLSDKAFRLHVSALCWCNANLTDGCITTSELRYVSDVSSPKRYARELVDAGLWHETEQGWSVHDYLEFQASAEKIKEDRAAKRARQERWVERKRMERDASRDASHDASEDLSGDAPPLPLPSHPIPRANTSSQSSIPPYPAGRPDDDDDDDLSREVDEMVMRLLAPLATQPITREHAAWVRKTILAKGRGRVQHKAAYVRRALEKDPRPYLPQQPTTTAAATPAGRCLIHHQDLPCRGCAADAKARAD
ncbi:hypothetical protein ACQP1V_43225 (plasmid) [Microtetraspora malaysiensis]|uniref:hypothetical protein n=1 Tax=Microtetraspora malaysiensis TaxID=161358 RepID=UPI003D8D647E